MSGVVALIATNEIVRAWLTLGYPRAARKPVPTLPDRLGARPVLGVRAGRSAPRPPTIARRSRYSSP